MNLVTIATTTIRQDAAGRYCLNDLHAAAGGIQHHRPSKWLATKQAQELLAAIESTATGNLEARIRASNSIRGRGITATYVVKDLVYAYAMWISPAFHLKVIRAYDAAVTGEINQHQAYWFVRRPHWPAIRDRVLAGERYRDIAYALGFSVGRVTRAVRRMIAVGLLAPAAVAHAQRGPARRAALLQMPSWGQQLTLALGS